MSADKPDEIGPITLIARKIGETAGIPNHIERARQICKLVLELHSAWQPIESAPKDGTEILVTDGIRRRVAHWETSLVTGWFVPLHSGGGSFIEATGWMPLPPSPAPSGRRA